MNIQLKKGNLDLCVLSLLSRSDMYGYELVNTISKEIEISEGTIYPLLKRIKDEKLVSTYLMESNEGPPRKYYSITQEGLEKKQELMDEWVKFVTSMNRLLNTET